MGSTARARPARARTPCGVGADFKGLGVLPTSGRNGLGQLRAAQTPRQRASRAGAGGVTVSFPVSDWQRLIEIFSKILNRSAQSDE
jgi:hypothetical protein